MPGVARLTRSWPERIGTLDPHREPVLRMGLPAENLAAGGSLSPSAVAAIAAIRGRYLNAAGCWPKRRSNVGDESCNRRSGVEKMADREIRTLLASGSTGGLRSCRKFSRNSRINKQQPFCEPSRNDIRVMPGGCVGESGYTEFQRVALEQWASSVPPRFRSRKESSTLVLDQFGRILSCSPCAERIFGTSQVSMLGRGISDFVSGLFHAGSSPGHSARHLVYLCAGGGWCRFEARDAAGQSFPVEINLTRMASIDTGRDRYLMDVRQPAPAPTY